MMTRSEVAAWLLERDGYCIASHCKPDGDTIGSTAALCLGLRKLGKTAYVLENSQLSGHLSFLHEGLSKPEAEAGDILISVDTASRDRVQGVVNDPIALRIDHHATAVGYTELELVDPTAAACGEIIYDILMEMGVSMDEELAKALYVAISTDTGCFRFANTTAKTYSVAAACAATGVNLYPITQMLFDTNSLTKLRIQSWIVGNTRFFEQGKLALCAMPRQVEEGATSDDTENLSGFLRSIDGVRLCVLLRESEDGAIRLSARSVPGYDASELCRKFGGGGHKGAAGATLHMSLSEAEAAVEKLLPQLYGAGEGT